MFCPYCGQYASEDANFCSACGARLQGQEPVQRGEIEQARPTAAARPIHKLLIALICVSLVLLAAVGVLTGMLVQRRSGTREPELHSQTMTEVPTEAVQTAAQPTQAQAQAPKTEQTEAETEAPTQPTEPELAETGREIEIRSDLQYRLNLFLSNFSESFFADYDGLSPESPDFNRLMLVFSWYNLNKHSDLRFNQANAILSYEQMNERWERFFGATLTRPEAGTVIEGPNRQKISFYDGYFYTPLGDGDAHADFTVARALFDNGDGSYTVYFDVYTAADDALGGAHLTDDSYFSLNPDTVAGRNVRYLHSGSAVLQADPAGGSGRYTLLEYEIEETA